MGLQELLRHRTARMILIREHHDAKTTDSQKFRDLVTEVEGLNGEIRKIDPNDKDPLAEPQDRDRVPDPLQNRGNEPDGRVSNGVPTGRCLRSDQRLVDMPSMRSSLPSGVQADRLSFDRWLRGKITGRWDGAESERALEVGDGSTGAGLGVPSYLSSMVIDAVRAASVTSQAGVRTIPLQGSDVGYLRLDSDPTAEWLGESVHATASDPAFSLVRFQPRTLTAMCKASIEAIEDAVELDSQIMRSLSEALAAELDRVVLLGSGADAEPLGIRNYPGVTVSDENGDSIEVYGHFTQAIHALRAANVTGRLAGIWHPQVDREMDQAVDTTGQPLRPPPSVEQLRKFSTSKIPIDGGDVTDLFFGDFTQAVVGVRTGLRLEASRVAADDTADGSGGSAFTQRQLWVRAYLRADVALFRPHFYVLQDVDAVWVDPSA